MKLKKYVDPVCWEPSYEPDGEFYPNNHYPEKTDPQFCNGCGMKVFEKEEEDKK